MSLHEPNQAFGLMRQAGVEQVLRADAGDELLHSVTSVLGVLDKPAIPAWAVKETAKWLVRLPHRLQTTLEEEGEEAAIKWVTGLRWRTDGLLRATELGTLFHGLAEEYSLTGIRPKVVSEMHPAYTSKGLTMDARDVAALVCMLDRFDGFLQMFQPQYLATEFVVFSPRHDGYGFAGTCDGIFVIDGQRLIFDYKTSRDTWDSTGNVKTPYPEVSLQLAAYRNAPLAAVWKARRTELAKRRYYLLSSAERSAAVSLPPVDGGVVVLVTPQHLAVHPVRCGAEEYENFLYCLEVARWTWDQAPAAVGNAMTPPFAEAPTGDPFQGLPR
jgi:hypothetical protein